MINGKIKKANKECESCIHAPVCAYKEHYEDAVKLYEAAIDEAGKYPWFKIDINCVQYESIIRTLQRGNQRTK